MVAFYGVRGVGSIYYLAYAAGQVEFWDEEPLWALVGFTILLSTLGHGFTAGIAMKRRLDRRGAKVNHRAGGQLGREGRGPLQWFPMICS